MAEVPLDGDRNVEDIRADLVASYRAHGFEPHSDLRGIAGVLKATHGPPVLRLPRLAKLAVAGFQALRRDAGGAGDRTHAGEDDSLAWLPQAFRLYAIYGVTSIGLAVAARRASGLLRILLIVLAVGLAAVTAWSVLFMGGLEIVLRIARSGSSVPDDGQRD